LSAIYAMASNVSNDQLSQQQSFKDMAGIGSMICGWYDGRDAPQRGRQFFGLCGLSAADRQRPKSLLTLYGRGQIA
jgi:hypothetical protein